MVFRVLWLVLRSKYQPRVSVWGTYQKTFRVRLRDLDLLRHMTNSAYLALMDLGRMDLVLRSGFWAAMNQNGMYSIIASQTITYRKSLKFGDRFQIETRVAGADEEAVYFHQRFTMSGEICAEAVVRQRFLRRAGGVVPMKEMLALVDPIPDDREPAPWMLEWAASSRLPSRRDPAVSTWMKTDEGSTGTHQ
jgi:YbgC/YbaW family acyl-CoA thioester hydrolase